MNSQLIWIDSYRNMQNIRKVRILSISLCMILATFSYKILTDGMSA